MFISDIRLIKSDEMGFFFVYIFAHIDLYPEISIFLSNTFLICYLIRLIDSTIGYVRNLFIAHLYNSTLILQPSDTNRNCPILDLKTRLTTPVEFPADVRQVN